MTCFLREMHRYGVSEPGDGLAPETDKQGIASEIKGEHGLRTLIGDLSYFSPHVYP